MSDLISRQAAIDALGEEPLVWYGGEDEIAERNQWRRAVKAIKAVPTVQPEIHFDEWCHDCKEYDQEEHCCHRWTKVIRQTVEEIKEAQPKRKKGEWIDNETSFADGVRQTCTCSVCGRRSVRPLGDFCRWCGADMRGDDNG